MSFAQEYLDLMTEAHKELSTMFQTYKNLELFGRTVTFTDKYASDIIQGSVEEWDDYERIVVRHPITCTEYKITFDSADDILFLGHFLKESLDFEKFVTNAFRWDLEDFLEPFRNWEDPIIVKDRVGLKQLFSVFTQEDLEKLSTCYATAVKAYITDKYRNLYTELRNKHPGLLYYPNYGFSYSCDEYYESSACY